MTIILYAIPGFFLLMAIELAVDRAKGTGYYRLNDAISSLSIGMLSRVAGILKAIIPLSIYALVAADLALLTWPETLLGWVLAFVIYDFFYYWNHRLGHEMSVLWAAHVVHHSSEEYNLTTALRQTSGSFLNWLFFIPLAFLGVPLEMMVSIAALNLVYQFWVHTRHINTLGIVDKILVTPSNHRVHHAQNDRYIDKNYGGVFIIWDRLFNTFEEENPDDPPVYGIRTPLHSWNPLWSNLHLYKQLASDSVRTKRWQDKCKVWFGRTGYRPDDVLANMPPKKGFDLNTFQKYDIVLTATEKMYALVQLFVALVLTLSLLLQISQFGLVLQFTYSALLVYVLMCLGWAIERKPFVKAAELIKWVLVFVALIALPNPAWVVISIFVLALCSGASLLITKRPLDVNV